jgi:L-galactose dehydrogenase
MEYRALGNTGLTVSAIGYGASPLGGVYGSIDVDEGIRAVHTALDLGVNIIDVAPYYGATVAEAVLGRALRGVERSSYILATKVGRYGDDEFDFSAARVTRSVDESLARLGIEYVDLIQCHDVEFGDLDMIAEETVAALRDLREAGKVRFIGVTGYPLDPLAYLAERAGLDTVLSYCRYTLADRALLGWTDRFARAGAGVINASPIGMGLLTQAGPPAWHPAGPALRAAAARAAEVCRARGVDIARVAFQFSVAPPQFATTVVGTASAERIARNIAWAEQPADEELLRDIDDVLAPVRDTTWPTGRPENWAARPEPQR